MINSCRSLNLIVSKEVTSFSENNAVAEGSVQQNHELQAQEGEATHGLEAEGASGRQGDAGSAWTPGK